MTNNENEMIEKKEQARQVLFKRIIPWGIVGIITFIIILFIDLQSLPNTRFGIGLALILSYTIFCIPWFFDVIKKNANRKSTEYNQDKYKPTNGLEAKHGISAGKDVFDAIVIAFTIVFKVPYHLVKTVYILNKK